MNKFIEEHGEAILATAFVAFAIGYSIFNCDIDSYVAGFASGVAALTAAIMWLD